MPQGHVWRKLKICLCKRITYPPSQIIWNPRNQSDSGSRRLDMLGRLRFVSLDHNGSLTMGSNQKFCGQHQSLPVVWISIAVYWEREYVAASELTSKVACWKVLQACPEKMTMTIRKPYTRTDQISDWCSWYESKYFCDKTICSPHGRLQALWALPPDWLDHRWFVKFTQEHSLLMQYP